MGISDKAPIIPNPELLDVVIGNIQKGLIEKIGWLDRAFGRAERLVKTYPDNTNRNSRETRYYTPNVYAGGNEYLEVSPDANIGNFSFVWVDDPQNVDWLPGVSIGIKTNFSLIVWFDYRKVFNDPNARNKEAVKREILDALNGGIWLKNGRLKITKVWEKAENVYKGFSLDEVDNQFLMHPYGGFRFEGELGIAETCKI